MIYDPADIRVSSPRASRRRPLDPRADKRKREPEEQNVPESPSVPSQDSVTDSLLISNNAKPSPTEGEDRIAKDEDRSFDTPVLDASKPKDSLESKSSGIHSMSLKDVELYPSRGFGRPSPR
jgi:hypothetical protein